MKILQFLHKKIKEPSAIGFCSASAFYLLGALFISDIFANSPSSLEKNGTHKISLRLASNQQVSRVEPSPSPPKRKRKKYHRPKPMPPEFLRADNPVSPLEPIQEEEKEIKQEEKIEDVALETKSKNETIQEGAEFEALAYNEGLSDEFLSRVHHAISNYNSYPRMARMRRMQGEVVLEFILEVDGKFHGLKIIKSNAGDILNKSALKALSRASKDFPLPPKRVRIKVPIVYHLN